MIRSAFPRETLDIIERVREVVDTIRPAVFFNASDRTGALEPHPVSMHIEHTPDEFCSVCGVDSMTGDGSAGCAYQRSCDDAFVSSMSTSLMQLSSQSSLRETEPHRSTSTQQLLQSPDAAEAQFVVLASLDVITTAANSTTFDTALVKEALSHSLGLDVDDPYHAISGEGAVQVEVVSSAVDEMFAHMFPDELRNEGGRRFLETGAGGGNEPIEMESHRHRVVVATASQSRKEDILQALEVDDPERQASRRLWALDDDQGPDVDTKHVGPSSASKLAAHIASYIQQHGGEAQRSVERVEVSFERMLSVPTNHATLGLGSGAFASDFGEMTVLMMDPRMPREPLSAVVYERAYRLVIERFPPRSIIRVAAIRAPSDGEEAEEGDQGHVLAITMTDEMGTATVPNLRFSPPRLFPPGDYEIQALVLRTQAFGLSPLFTLSHEGPERRAFRNRY